MILDLIASFMATDAILTVGIVNYKVDLGIFVPQFDLYLLFSCTKYKV